MQHYHMWFNLIDSHKDLEFARAVEAYMGYLQGQGKIEGWRLTRRKFGFGPEALGEFHCEVWTGDLAAAYGKKALEVGHPDLAVLWTEEALQLRRDAGGSVSGVQRAG